MHNTSTPTSSRATDLRIHINGHQQIGHLDGVPPRRNSTREHQATHDRPVDTGPSIPPLSPGSLWITGTVPRGTTRTTTAPRSPATGPPTAGSRRHVSSRWLSDRHEQPHTASRRPNGMLPPDDTTTPGATSCARSDPRSSRGGGASTAAPGAQDHHHPVDSQSHRSPDDRRWSRRGQDAHRTAGWLQPS